MQSSPDRTQRFFYWKKAGRLFFAVSACIGSFLVYGVFLLPSLLSLETTETFIEKSLIQVLGVPCEIEDIQCSWTGGIRISGFHLHAPPEVVPETILRIKTFAMEIPFLELVTQGRAGIRLYMNGVALNILRDARGKTNLDVLTASPSAAEQPPVPEVGKEKEAASPFVLPLDVGAVVELRQLSVSVNDQVTDKRLLVENGEVILNAPSIRSRDVGLRLHMDIALNERQLPPVDLKFAAADFIDPASGMISPETIVIDVDGSLPGTRLSVTGRLAGQGLQSDVQINLQEVFETISPLLDSRTASSHLEGTLAISATAMRTAKDQVAFDTAVALDRASLSGPLLQGKSVSGLHLLLTNTGKIDLAGKRMELTNGRLELLQDSRIHYHGHMGFDPKTADADSLFLVDSASIGIGELLKFGHSFLPPGLPVQFGEDQDAPTLDIRQAAVNGNLFTGECAATIEKLNLTVPIVRVDEKDMKVQTDGINFYLYDLSAGLHGYFPKDVRFDSSLNVDAVSVDGPQVIQAKKIAVPRFQFQVTGIHKSPEALFGYAAELSGKQQLTIGEIQLPPLAVATNIHQTLDGVCRLLPERKIQVGVREIQLGAADLKVRHYSIGQLQVPVNVKGVISQLEINSLQPLQLYVSHCQNQIQVGDILALDMTTEVRDTAIQLSETVGNIRVNMGSLFEKLGKKPAQISLLNGMVQFDWQVRARRPSSPELSRLKTGVISDLRKDLPFIDELQTGISLKQISTDLSLTPNLDFQLKDITAEPLLSYSYNGKEGRGDFSGRLILGSLKSAALPVTDEAVSAQFSFSGKHQSLNQLSLNQNLEIPSFGLTESVSLTLSGLEKFVFHNREKNLPYFLKQTGGVFSGKIDIRDMAVIGRLQKDITARGALQAGLNLLLVPGTRAGGDAWVHLSDIDLEKAGQFRIQNLSGDIRLEKEYLLAGNRPDAFDAIQSESQIHLSNQVLQWNTSSRPHAPVHFSESVQNRFNPYNTPYQEMMIRFTTAESTGGPLPIRLQHFQTGLELVEGLPRIHNFQVDLLGGTMISSVAVQKTGNGFYIPVNVSFSGIQTERFWGITVDPDQKKDTEVTGRFNAYIPVTSDMNDFLNDLQVDVLFIHIGSMALEQLLYSLDPTESNEKIVSQRKMVEQGSPKWIQLTVRDGALSLEGVVTVKGVDIDIPQVRRLNITGLSGLDKLEDGLKKLTPLLTILQSMSADAVRLDQAQNSVGFFVTQPAGNVASRERGFAGRQ